jgi:hypothetical protein
MSRSVAGQGVSEQNAQRLCSQWGGVVIRIGKSKLNDPLNPADRHSDVTQRRLRSYRQKQIVQTSRRIINIKRTGYPQHCVGGGCGIVGRRVRQNYRVRLRVWQIERASERVAKLVMQSHTHRA